MNLLDPITRNGRAFFLAYDQGLEHGPIDFNDENFDPAFIVKLADSGYFTSVIFQKGIAEKYYDTKQHPTPLIVKLNGKTTFQSGEPYAPRLCSVEEAIALGARGVGYTIYPGSTYQEQMMNDFAGIEETAHKNNLAVILWLYPRGENVKGKEKSKEVLTYAARIGLELGADMIKIYYPDDPSAFGEMVKVAGRVKVLVSGGTKQNDEKLFSLAKQVLLQGGAGLAVGRNIWQSDQPLERAKKLAEIIFNYV